MALMLHSSHAVSHGRQLVPLKYVPYIQVIQSVEETELQVLQGSVHTTHSVPESDLPTTQSQVGGGNLFPVSSPQVVQ